MALATYGLWTDVRATPPSELFFSQYIEGSSFNKALEIYNGTGSSVDLGSGGYTIEMYFNGNTSPGTTISLTGTVADGDVYVIADDGADPTILAQADLTSTFSFFNGDDAVVLKKGGVVIDAIGQVGVDPGSEWGSGDQSTQNNTLVRDPGVCAGDSNAADTFDPSLEWSGFPNDTFDGLGSHSVTCNGGPGPSVVINEVDSDNSGIDNLEFIELYDGGGGNTPLDGLVVVLYNGSDDASYGAFDLDGLATDANGYFVIGTVPESDLYVSPGSSGWLQNGADAVALYVGDAADFPSDTPVTTTGLVDAIVYGTNDADDPGLLPLLNPGQPQVDEDGAGDKDGDSMQRCPNGDGGPRNTDSFAPWPPTPGAENLCGVVPPGGFVKIHDVQGSGPAVTAPGATVTVEGVVVGDYQGAGELGGFFVQEEDSDADTDPTTSEGIFVFCGAPCAVDVLEGNVVAVTGVQEEFSGMSQINVTGPGGGVTIVDGSDNLNLVTPVPVDLPAPGSTSAEGTFEQFEGMLVQFEDELTVTEHFQLGRFGQIVLSEGGRQRQFTDANAPSVPDFAVHLEDIAKRRILLDDVSYIQDRDPVYHPQPGGFSAANFLRGGDTVSHLTGVLHWSTAGSSGTDAWRVRPQQTHPVQFVVGNPRTTAPANVGGSLKVAELNVLNYFTTVDDGSASCNTLCRGADSLAELERQTTKLVAALQTIDADVVGLVGMENNPSGSSQALVDALNAQVGAGTYSFVDTGTIGSDAIKVALIYKPATVSPTGDFKLLDSSIDPDFIDTKNHPVLIQTFDEISTGGRVTVAVNHLKSKGSSCGDVGDPDTNDGQGNCNQTRTAAVQALVDYLGTDPTASGDPDFLIIGDLNAYAKEDPITAIKSAGYDDLIGLLVGPEAYTYVFDGQWGHLDQALSSSSLTGQITGVTAWHINADEANLLDYNDTIQDPAEASFEAKPGTNELYSPDPYRSSDHDPVVIGLALTPPASCSDDVLISDYQTTAGSQFVEIANAGSSTIDLEGCALVTFNVFTETSVGSATAALSGTLSPGETTQVGVSGMPTGPGAFGLFDRSTPPPDGTPFSTDDEITGMVYLSNDTVYGIGHLTVPAYNSIYSCIYGGSGAGPFSRPFQAASTCLGP